jgi:hypothetical protein
MTTKKNTTTVNARTNTFTKTVQNCTEAYNKMARMIAGKDFPKDVVGFAILVTDTEGTVSIATMPGTRNNAILMGAYYQNDVMQKVNDEQRNNNMTEILGTILKTAPTDTVRQ